MAQNAFGLTSLYDPSIAVDQSALERQMALAQALRKSALTPVETQGRQVGGVGYKVSPWEGMAKALQAYQANKLDSDTDASRLSLAQKQAQAMKAAAEGMFGDAPGAAAPAVLAPQPSGLPAGVTPEAMTAGGFPQPPTAPQTAPQSVAPDAETQQLKRAAMAAYLRGDNATVSKLVENFVGLTPDQKNMRAKGIDPRQLGAAELAKAEKEGLMEIGPNQTVWDPSSNQTRFTAPSAPSAPVQELEQTLLRAGIDPKSPQGQALFSQFAQRQVTHQPAANVNVKTGGSLAEQVGPIMKESQAKAQGAAAQIDAANRVISAANSKVFAGPGANVRLAGSQLSQMAGIGGKDEAEKIANTRAMVRGFAELTLQGRQQMRGQGSITESEGALAERAMSGKIEDLTVPEIKQLAEASKRTAQYQMQFHNQKLDAMRRDPEISKLVPFYESPIMGGSEAKPGQVRKVDW